VGVGAAVLVGAVVGGDGSAAMQAPLVCPPYAALQQASIDEYVGRPLGTGRVAMHFPEGQANEESG
jgi:hypothetical protein